MFAFMQSSLGLFRVIGSSEHMPMLSLLAHLSVYFNIFLFVSFIKLEGRQTTRRITLRFTDLEGMQRLAFSYS